MLTFPVWVPVGVSQWRVNQVNQIKDHHKSPLLRQSVDYIVQIHSLEKKTKGSEGDSTWLNLVRWSLTGRLLYTKGVPPLDHLKHLHILVKGDYRSDQVKNTIFKLLFSKFKQRNETHVMRNDCRTYENNTEFDLWDGTV